ncbi:kinesin-II 95 kDa subunit [Planoprotostelium fungivorum]|uniref:Kinesin-like protein n=1 Tax=Planoprotostelium fungivorum TaxID=1890364 RepID=A0A2P6NDF0_9EUKA|nr:kinesin-II 95 kDa subunit [Planoprotostelium fungivorum]
MAEAVKVVIRCRPMNGTERAASRQSIVTMDTNKGLVTVKNPADKSDKAFSFDTVYDWNSTQKAVYNETVYPIVECVLNGYNGTIFAYGQTGTGKTHTMSGVPSDPELKGVIPNAFENIFDYINTKGKENPNTTYLVTASFLEIYNEEVRDLLSETPTKKLDLKEHPETGVYVKDLEAKIVKTVPEMDHWMEKGNGNRSVGFTKMNAGSSRSHSIFTIVVESSTIVEGSADPVVKRGKLHLVDLAGSERQSKTEAEGQRLKEAAKINLSLSALGNVISALVDGKGGHIPYRDSKLTRLLQDSLGGNSKTVMIAAMGPADHNYDETMSTLRYANRAKNIKNKPVVNEDPKDAQIRQYQEEIDKLKQMLQQGGGITVEEDGHTVEADQVIEEIVEEVVEHSGLDEATIKEIKSQKDEEINAVLAQKGVVEEERRRITEQLHKIKETEDKQLRARQELENKLAAMQANLFAGGENLVDQVERQEQELRMQAHALEQKAIEERRLKRALTQRAEEVSLHTKEFSSLAEEVDVKTKQLKKLFTKIQQEEWQTEKTEMLDTIRELSKQLKLKLLTIHSYIPQDELHRIERRAQWDNESQDWKIIHIEYCGNTMAKKRGSVIEQDPDDLKQPPPVDAWSESNNNIFYSYNGGPPKKGEARPAW